MNSYKKYFLVAKSTFEEALTYRISFLIWRLRTIIGFCSIYFIWLAVLPSGSVIGSYDQRTMLTYVFITSFLGSIIQSSRSYALGEEINNGNLSNFLIRPMNYFMYWFSKDLGDKAMNILLSIIEITVLFFILKPNFFIQGNILYILFFLIAVAIGVIIYFLLNILFGTIGFWSQDTWAPRFLLYIVLSFFAGGLFPLDLLPKNYYLILSNSPFAYFYYLPIKIYLGQMSYAESLMRLMVGIVWCGGLYASVQYIWSKGLRVYTAQGR